MSTLSDSRRLRRSIAIAILLALSAPAVGAEEVFANLPGSWAGGGTAVLQDGTTERIKCRATYSVTPSGTVVHQVLACASDSYKIDMRSDIVYQNGALAGTWVETGRKVDGSIVGRIDGDVITTKVSGLTFHADVAIVTRDNKQSIKINSEGSYAKAVSIDLTSR